MTFMTHQGLIVKDIILNNKKSNTTRKKLKRTSENI